MEGRTIQRPASLGFRERMLGPVQGKQQIVNNCTGNEDRPPPPPKITPFPTENPQKKLSLTQECFLTGYWNDPNGTYGEP